MKNILVLLLGLFLVACGGDKKRYSSSIDKGHILNQQLTFNSPYSLIASYAKEAELQMRNMAKSASTYILYNGTAPPDCWETMKEEGYIEIKQAVTENWEFECSWELDEDDGIVGAITATSTYKNNAGAGKVIEYQIETEEFTGYGQGNPE